MFTIIKKASSRRGAFALWGKAKTSSPIIIHKQNVLFLSSSNRLRSRRPTLRAQVGGGSRGHQRGGSSGSNHNKNGSTSIPPYYVWIGAGGTTLIVASVYYTYLDKAPLTQRQRWIATSPEWERQMGDEEYQNLLRQFRANILPPNHRASVTVQRVGSRIAEASNVLAKRYNLPLASQETAANIPFTYTVVRSEMANAFVLPGNHVFVMTGLFKYVRNEDDLAAVLGHEAAHNLARHAGEKISGNLVVSLLAQLSLILDPSGVLFHFFLPAASLFRELPNSRTQETEADQIGLYLAAEACYDPRAAKRVFAAMKADSDEDSKSPPEFLSTHPSHDSRISNFDDWLPDAMNRYQGDDDDYGSSGNRCAHARRAMAQARTQAALRREQQNNGGY